MKNKLLRILAALAACAVTQRLLGYESGFAVMAITPFAGTVSLKDLVAKANGAKNAWLEARKAKKDKAELDELGGEYNRLQKFIDDAAVEGKKDDDQIEVKAPAAESVVTLEEIGDTVAKEVTKQINTLLKDGQKATQEAVTKLIQDEFAKMAGDSTTISAGDIATLVQNSAKSAFDTFRREKKQTRGDDGSSLERGMIEMPCSLRKGNLPLHMKQLCNRLMGKHQDEGIDSRDLAKGKELEEKLWVGLQVNGAKALTSTGTGTGEEWVPRSLSSELYRRMYLDSQLAQAYLSTEVDMPTDPYDFPLLTTRPTFKQNNTQANRPSDASDPGTSKFTLTTKKLMAICQFSYEADEDSIVPILPRLQTVLAEAAAAALETAIINGDTTSTHQDSDVTDANDAQKIWKGYRKLFIAASLKSDMTSGGISRANLLALVKLMGKFGANTRNLLWIVGSKGWNSLMGLDEVVNFYQRGSVGNYAAGGPPLAPWGGQIILSEQVKENLNASGVYDGSTTTKGTLIVVDKSKFLLGSRREFMIEVHRNPYAQTNDIIASFRKAFQPVETPASGTAAYGAVGYNYTA